ncbi:MAG: acetate kinase, partial [Bdellovibrio bacteriovorus]
MKVLVLNSGSSSIKFQLFDSDGWRALASGAVSRIGEAEAEIRAKWLDRDGQPQTREERLPISNHQDGIDRIIAGLRQGGVLADL